LWDEFRIGRKKLVSLTASLLRVFRNLGIVCLLGIIAFVLYVTPVYVDHNRMSREVLEALEAMPLPPGAVVTKKGWDVGAYEGAGNLCEGLGFIEIKSDAPKQEISDFYQRLFPNAGRKVDADFGIASMNDHSFPTPDDIGDLFAQIPPETAQSTYVIWGKRPLSELSWDIRGW
jgi:hypothetical protein